MIRARRGGRTNLKLHFCGAGIVPSGSPPYRISEREWSERGARCSIDAGSPAGGRARPRWHQDPGYAVPVGSESRSLLSRSDCRPSCISRFRHARFLPLSDPARPVAGQARGVHACFGVTCREGSRRSPICPKYRIQIRKFEYSHICRHSGPVRPLCQVMQSQCFHALGRKKS